MFWGLAFAIAFVSLLMLFWPLIRERGLARSAALALVSVTLLLTFLLYREVGSPGAIGVTAPVQDEAVAAQDQQAQMESLLQDLESRLQQDPENLEGWMMLGRSYKTLQRFAKSVDAFERAMVLAPDEPAVMVELAEARMFASGNPVVGEQEQALLNRALSLDPSSQKALWLLGVTASQAGNDASAIDYWTRLLSLMTPGTGAYDAVTQQLNLARGRIGIEPVASASGVSIAVTVEAADTPVPAEAALFVIARAPGQQSGPPIAVRRIASPKFPLNLTLTDEHSMMPGSPLSGHVQVSLVARLSLSGQAQREDGDIESAAVEHELGSGDDVSLVLALP